MKPKKIPMRMCVGCREMKPKRELIRVVRSPEGEVSLDPVGKKPGRGAYVCRNENCLKRAIKQKQLERQLEVQLTEEVATQLQETIAALPADGGEDVLG
ncbi:MAG: YlxR family protein [Clostridia bacterium]|nr:YlxR family protein [Clostridia bacterium]